MNIIEKLKKRPIAKNVYFKYDYYEKDNEYYQEKIIPGLSLNTNHPLCNDPLRTCRDFGLMYKNYYLEIPLLSEVKKAHKYLSQDIYLRQVILKDLKKIDDTMAIFGLRIFIRSGYRHPELQMIIIDEFKKIKGDNFAKKMFCFHHLSHSTGGAFDVDIWDDKNKLFLKTKSPRGCGRYILEESNLDTGEIEIRDNRRLIHNVLTSNAILDNPFIAHPYEYWHHGRNEKLSAFFSASTHEIFYDILY